MRLQRTRRPRLRSGRSLRSLGSPLKRYPLGRRAMHVLALGLATVGFPVAMAGQPASPEGSRSASWVVCPGRGIGPVTLGMTPEEVKVIAGEPDVKTERRWGYSKDSVFVAFSEAGHVIVIEAGLGPPWKGSPPSQFAGRTDNGIGIGSTREAVLAALGPPRTDGERGDLETLSYGQVGVMLALWHGRVVSIYVRRPAP
jgi:hypothetical protein